MLRIGLLTSGVERLAVAATSKKTDPKHDESFLLM